MRSMTLSDLVREVYYIQEKVLLDFRYWDDKYREVIQELRLVLQELQKEEDWLWLRERLVLGPCDDYGRRGSIPEFALPDWVYKPSSLHDDSVRLHATRRNGTIVERDYLVAPWSPMGEMAHPHTEWYTGWGGVNVPDLDLFAVNVGGVVTFNRPLTRGERRRVAVTDVQREIRLPEVPPRADEYEKADEKQRAKWDHYYCEEQWLSEVPDPNYVTTRTAALHCVGSPVAQMRMQDLTDNAQKLLSAMREANAMATSPNHVEWVIPGYTNVV